MVYVHTKCYYGISKAYEFFKADIPGEAHKKEEFAGRLLKYDVSLDQFRNEMAKPNILG